MIIFIIIIDIIKMEFINRKNELKEMSFLEKKKPSFLVITGKRRVGKTELILHYMKERGIYFFVDSKKSELLLINEYLGLIKSKLGIPEYVQFKSLEELFQYIFDISKKKELIIAIDEFQRFIKVNPSIIEQFQKLWDLNHKKSKIFLIVSGSSVGMMKKIFQEEGSPLFKRADNIIKLKPFNFSEVFEVFDLIGIKNFEEKLKTYLIFGGTIYYYTIIEKYGGKTSDEIISALLLRENSPLENEIPEILIEEFNKNHPTYYEILSVLSFGKNTKKEMADFIHIEETSLSPYLRDLMDIIGIVSYEVSPTKQEKNTKKGKYILTDNFFNFWFRYVYKNSSYFQRREYEKIKALISEDINNFYGKMFEKFIRDEITMNFFEFDKIGRWEGVFRENNIRKPTEIDIVAINNKKEIFFAECKWQDNINSLSILNNLSNKSKIVEWNNKNRTEIFAVFAKSFSKKINNFEGKKVYCIDLEDIRKIAERKTQGLKI